MSPNAETIGWFQTTLYHLKTILTNGNQDSDNEKYEPMNRWFGQQILRPFVHLSGQIGSPLTKCTFNRYRPQLFNSPGTCAVHTYNQSTIAVIIDFRIVSNLLDKSSSFFTLVSKCFGENYVDPINILCAHITGRILRSTVRYLRSS